MLFRIDSHRSLTDTEGDIMSRNLHIAAAIVGCALAEAACFLVLVVLMMGGPNLLWILVGVALGSGLVLALRRPKTVEEIL